MLKWYFLGNKYCFSVLKCHFTTLKCLFRNVPSLGIFLISHVILSVSSSVS